MRPGQQQQNKQRMRGRGRKGPNPLSRSYESNGPDVKIRGTAQHIAEKYTTLARDASASGDRVMAENYLQHAEHYGRIVAAAQGSFQLQRDEREIEYDEDGEEIFEESGFNGQNQPDIQPPQPQMREHRDGQRDNAYRDNAQRDGQQRDNGQPREHQARDNNQRDRGYRDNNRDSGNRDGNRAERAGDNPNRENRDNPNRDGANRDNNSHRQRDFHRDNRNDRGQREARENRDAQAERPAAQVPDGLGPQPFVGLPLAAVAPTEASVERPRDEEIRRDAPVTPQPVPAELAGADDAVSGDVAPQRGENEPRRRGRPRRIRLEDREAAAATGERTDASAPAAVEAPVADLLSPVAPQAEAAQQGPETSAPVSPPVEGAGEEAKVKRRPGRPRKKKPEDEATDEGGDHMPAFLMASNG